METSDNFNKQLFELAEAKKNWYDTEEMIKILEEYRNLLGVVNNLINLLEKKGLIQPDPYKHDKKISDIAVPEEIPFLDSERSMVIGARLSDFESMLDFICNIFKFSVATVSVERIKTLLALNNYFQWNSLVPNSAKPNTKGLAEIIHAIKMGTDTLSVSVLNETINYASKTVSRINGLLKELTDFQKEIYKIEIRKCIFEHPSYSHEKSQKSNQDALQQIKKLFPQVLGKKPFYSELIDELIQEEYSPEKQKFRETLLKKFEISSNKKEEKKIQINTKELLMDAVRALGAAAPLFEQIVQKVDENHKVLQSEHNGFLDKLLALIRQAFNRPEKPDRGRQVRAPIWRRPAGIPPYGWRPVLASARGPAAWQRCGTPALWVESCRHISPLANGRWSPTANAGYGRTGSDPCLPRRSYPSPAPCEAAGRGSESDVLDDPYTNEKLMRCGSAYPSAKDISRANP